MITLAFRMTLAEFVPLSYNVKNSTCYDILTCGNHRAMLTLYFHRYLGLNSELTACSEDFYLSLWTELYHQP